MPTPTAEWDTPEFWNTHCWAKRFYGEPCARPATWRGPATASHALVREWRACDAHRQDTDEPIGGGLHCALMTEG